VSNISQILETAFLFNGDILIEKQFYAKRDQEMVKDRANLIKAITNMAENAFSDEIKHFSVGDHDILLMSRLIEQVNDPVNNSQKLYMYTIAEKNVNRKAVQDSMVNALFQFTNRFSTHDICEKQCSKFQEFKQRFDKIFKGLIYKSDAQIQAEKEKKQKELEKVFKSKDYKRITPQTY
jgi:hypothetical protein